MRLRVLPLLLLLLCGSSRSQNFNRNEQEAIDWLNQLYMNESGKIQTGEPESTINTRFESGTVDLTPKVDKIKKTVACVTDSGEAGICAKRTECNKDTPKIDSTSNFILRETNPCHYLQTCCPVNLSRRVPEKPLVAQDLGCGFSNPGASIFREKLGTSTSGYADFGEFPWMVALLKTRAAGWTDENYLGGGSIIHPSVVMTVAHKVYTHTSTPEELKCRAGEWDTQTENELETHQERVVQRIIVHEDFDITDVRYNVALLILKSPFVNRPHVGSACLSLALPPPGTVCYSMGWGEDFSKSNKYAILLKKIPLPLVGGDDCRRRYQNTRLGSEYSLHRSLTCAGGVAMVDTCIGDGGSPLVCPVGNPVDLRYAVVGMVAYGLECGTENIPGVYAKVPEFYDWVGRQMARQGLNKSSYELGAPTVSAQSQFILKSN